MGNRTFWKAMRLLCSPFSLAAIMLLFVNDQLLRRFWPSWWTGKLGDFAWLFFFPFALAVLFAGLIPPRVPRQERIVPWLAFGLTGGVFVLAKTLPVFHGLTVRTLEMLLGIPVALVRDPTDLTALVSLGMSWRFWKRQSHPTSFRAVPGWAVLSCAALLTLANSVPSVGIDRVCSEPQRVLAFDANDYVSTDGGLYWQNLDYKDGESGREMVSDDGGKTWQPWNEYFGEFCKSTRIPPIWTSTGQLAVDSNIQYRFTPGAIERTEDGGQSWHRSFTLSTSEAVSVYYVERCGDFNCAFEPGPLDAAMDPATGNVIFAMGLEGVLVRKSSGEWVWASVGGYSHVEPGRGDVIFTLLSGEILLAIGFALLSILTLLRRLHPSLRRRILLVSFWITWPIHAILMQAVIQESVFEGVEAIGHALTFAACLALAFLILWDMPAVAQHAPGLLKRLAVVGLSVAVLFLIPFVVWALDVVREYSVVFCPLAFGLGGVTLFGGNRWTRDLVQAVREKETAQG